MKLLYLQVNNLDSDPEDQFDDFLDEITEEELSSLLNVSSVD